MIINKEKEVVTSYSQVTTYLLGPEETKVTFTFGPFENENDLLVAIRDYEHGLDVQYKYIWKREELEGKS